MMGARFIQIHVSPRLTDMSVRSRGQVVIIDRHHLPLASRIRWNLDIIQLEARLHPLI